MILSALAALGIALLAMAPGIALMRGRATRPGQFAAAAVASLVVTMLATALLGAAWHGATGGSLPALTLVPVSLVALVIAMRFRPRETMPRPALEWESPAIAAVMVGFGFLTQALAIAEGRDGSLLIHAWYNADWFKHLGHVAALADYGVPARDIFNAGEPLHYYWLSYLLAGAGAAIGGDHWAALATAQAVIVALLCMVLYGAMRLVADSRKAALIVGLGAFFLCAPLSDAGEFLLYGADAMMNATRAPRGPELLGFAQYIPQHALVLAMLLAWFLLDRSEREGDSLPRLLGLASLVSALAVSTLLGAMVLAVYGLVQLWRRREKALVEVAAMAVASALLVLALNVIQLNNPASAIDSPLLTNEIEPGSLPVRIVNSMAIILTKLGLPLLVAAAVLVRWKPQTTDQRDAWRLAIVLFAVAPLALVASEVLLSPRLGFEARLRIPSLPAMGIALTLAAALAAAFSSSRKHGAVAMAALTALTLAALPSIVIRTAWHGNLRDSFTTVIPQQDRMVLAHLAAHSQPRDQAWQYPETPFLAEPSGRDAWVVTQAGRTVTGSQRATDFASAVPRIEAAARFYAGAEDADIPRAVSWVYLTRALHAQTYDQLVARMRAEDGWTRVSCYADACLFERKPANK
jgi:multisubunit Na+/H+ antiporter MnhB subunit